MTLRHSRARALRHFNPRDLRVHLVDDAGISLPGWLCRCANFGLACERDGRWEGAGMVDPITSRSCRIGRIHTRCLRRLNYLGICTHILTVEIRLNTTLRRTFVGYRGFLSTYKSITANSDKQILPKWAGLLYFSL